MSESRRYVVIEQYRLEWLSFVRIPVALVLILGITGVLTFVAERIVLVFSPDGTGGVGPIALLAFGFSLWVTTKVVGRIRSHGARTKVELTGDTVRYWLHDGTEHSFPNRDVKLVRRGWSTLSVEQGGKVHALPREVERQEGDGIEMGFLSMSALRLGHEDGRVRLYVVQADPGSRTGRLDALPFD